MTTCVKRFTPCIRLAYMEVLEAKQELERYLEKYYPDQVKNKWFWVDGTRDSSEVLTGGDWKRECQNTSAHAIEPPSSCNITAKVM